MASGGKQEELQPLHPSMAGKLDPAFEKLYNENVANTPKRPQDLDKLRTVYPVLYAYGRAPAPEVGKAYDATVPLDTGAETPVRVYLPATEGPWPVHVNFHSGGWVVGDLKTEAHLCQHICAKANVVVIDVDYPLVPDHPFPTAITTSFQVLKYLHEKGRGHFNIQQESISVGGTSAGAAIALALAHLARDAGIPLRLAVACAPTIDDFSKYATPRDSPWESMRENEHAPCVDWARLEWFGSLRRSNTEPNSGWLANFLLAPSFSSLPKTVIYTASADPLRDEGEAYGRKLAEAGSEVTLLRYQGVPHPFVHMDKALWQARDMIDRTAREIRLAHRDH